MKIIAILFLSFPLFLVAQVDTVVVFDIPSQTFQIVPIPPFDTLTTSEYVPGYIGNWQNQINLELNLPDSTPLNSTFAELTLASNDFDLLKYPVRTNVAIVWYDSIYEQHATCSGTLISENVVLTAAHCIGVHNDDNVFLWKREGMHVSPSHSGGYPQPSIGKIKVEKYVILKEYYNNEISYISKDIGLLILKEPIGREIGWLGFGFNYDSLFYTQPIFYNFSYPGKEGFDGENMQYFYGSFNYIDIFRSWVGHGGVGIAGMSGSNFFFSDNENAISYGELIFPNHYKIIRRENFYSIKQIVDLFKVGINEGVSNDNNDIVIYPNPMTENTTIEVKNPILLNNKLNFILFNSLGCECMEIDNIKQSKTMIKKGNLKPGIYFFRVRNGLEIVANGKLIIQ